MKWELLLLKLQNFPIILNQNLIKYRTIIEKFNIMNHHNFLVSLISWPICLEVWNLALEELAIFPFNLDSWKLKENEGLK